MIYKDIKNKFGILMNYSYVCKVKLNYIDMKQFLLMLIALVSLTSNAQEIFTYESGITVVKNDNRVMFFDDKYQMYEVFEEVFVKDSSTWVFNEDEVFVALLLDGKYVFMSDKTDRDVMLTDQQIQDVYFRRIKITVKQ
jgi:hypothetical protein